MSYNSSAGADGAGRTYQAVCEYYKKYGVQKEKVQVSEFVRWSSILQHVFLFTEKRKMFLFHFYHKVSM